MTIYFEVKNHIVFSICTVVSYTIVYFIYFTFLIYNNKPTKAITTKTATVTEIAIVAVVLLPESSTGFYTGLITSHLFSSER